MAGLPLSDRFGNRLVSCDSVAGTEPEPPEGDDSVPIPLALTVVVCAGRVLMVLDARRGQWELPGGMREREEAARQAAVRELAEEAGIVAADLESAAVAGFVLANPDRREYAAVYRLALRALPQLAADDEILGFRWWDPRSPVPDDMSSLDAEIAALVTSRWRAGTPGSTPRPAGPGFEEPVRQPNRPPGPARWVTVAAISDASG